MSEGKNTYPAYLTEDFYQRYFTKKEFKSFGEFGEFFDIMKRKIYIGEITDEVGSSVDSFINLFNEMDEDWNIPVEDRKPITVYVDSPGGDLTCGFTIVDSISRSKTPVITVNQGCAYSCGFLIFIAGHKRKTYPHSSFLSHEGSISIGGDANKFQNIADFYKIQRDMIKAITLEKTKIPEEVYDSHIKDDWWMTAEDAIELGIADEII